MLGTVTLSTEFTPSTVQVGKRDEIGRLYWSASKRKKRDPVYTLVGEKIIAAKTLWCVI